MPTYSYHCDACDRDFEKEQRIVEPPLKKCPLCGKSKARRMITNGNFILKGGGWYSDGYGSSTSKSKSNGSGGKKEKKENQDKKEAKDSSTSSSDASSSSSSSSSPAATGSGAE